MPTTFCGFSPMMFGRKQMKLLQGQNPSQISKEPKNSKEMKKDISSQSPCNFILIMELRKKIFTFRDIIDLPPSTASVSTDQLLIGTLKDLHKLFPESIQKFRIAELKKFTFEKVLINFCKALQGLGDTSKMSDELLNKFKYHIYDNDKCVNVDKLVEIAVAILNGLIKVAREKFDMIDEDDKNKEFSPKAKTFGRVLKGTYSDNGSSCASPVTPTSVLPELTNGSPRSSYSSSVLLPLRVQAVGKLNPVDVKRLTLDMLPKVRVHIPNSLNQKKNIAIEKQNKEAKGNSPVRKTMPSSPSKMQPSELLKDKVVAGKSPLSSPSPPSSPSTSTSILLKVRVRVPNSSNQKKTITIEKQKKEANGNSPVRKASTMVVKTRDSTSRNKTSEIPLSKSNNVCGDKRKLSSLSSSPSKMQQPSLLKDKVANKSPLHSPSASTLSSSPSKMQPSLLKDKVVAKKSPLPSPSSLPSAEVSLPSPPSRRAKISTDMDIDTRLLPPPPPPGPSPKVLSLPPPLHPSKLSINMGVDIRLFVPPSASPPASAATTPLLLQPNVVPGGPPFPPPLMLQPNVEVAQATLVAEEPQLPSSVSLLTNTIAGGIRLPLPRSSPPPASLKPNVATGTPLLPPPSVPLQSKEVATRAPLPPPPPLPTGTTSPMMLAKRSGLLPQPPPPVSPVNGGAAPPPPPPSATKSLRPKKTNTKLKRSSQMGNLYRVLRGKVEGYPVQSKSSTGKSVVGSFFSGKQGLSDALAEMTKRSAYFQQIEEDVEKYAKSIIELKTAISTFNTKDMTKLIKFHKHVESILENLTDETQVLARFEGFPTKKLEALRAASGLYLKFESMITALENLKIEPPLDELLDKVNRHFTKIKGDIDALERTKDEESKKFKSHNIEFDFQILVRIKEAMVDVSSNCMELAMKERREVKLRENEESRTKVEAQKKGCVKMLWRAFQMAFRVYTFAGGHDDRADKLSRELAQEIQTDPLHHKKLILHVQCRLKFFKIEKSSIIQQICEDTVELLINGKPETAFFHVTLR